MTRVVFRVDASRDIGTGHVRRCEVLARELKRRGAQVAFVCRSGPGDLSAWLERLGYRVQHLPAMSAAAADDFVQTRRILEDQATADWIVVDHYGLDAQWERSARGLAMHVMAIDDCVNRPHDCDLLLDQNLRRQERQTNGAVRLLSGPRFALISPEFAARRSAGLRARPSGRVRRLLVCFGGADPMDHTAAALEALRPHIASLEAAEVAVGPAHARRERIGTLCRNLGAILLEPTDDLAPVLAEADLVIGGGGTMSWERACLGAPTLAFSIAANQAGVIEALIEGGYAVGMPSIVAPQPAAMKAWVEVCLNAPAMLRGLGHRSAALTDGLGTQRVADTLCPAALLFRAATMSDAAQLLAWRNHPEIRAASLAPHAITAGEHQAWLERTLGDPDRDLLVAATNDGPVGVVRFDCNGDEAEISVYRVPKSQPERLRLVDQAIAWLATQRPQIRRVLAVVLPQNERSIQAFRRAGFRPTEHRLVLDIGGTS